MSPCHRDIDKYHMKATSYVASDESISLPMHLLLSKMHDVSDKRPVIMMRLLNPSTSDYGLSTNILLITGHGPKRLTYAASHQSLVTK